jgi:asparagine synthase (glutamine-hydrolysing)
MCGITCIVCPKCQNPEDYIKYVRQPIVDSSDKICHRGPDWSGIYQDHENDFVCSMGHERLSIVDPEGGEQPIVNKHYPKTALCVNGEIYNHQYIRDSMKDYKFMTKSDCEVIQALYHQSSDPIVVCQQLDGPFAFVLYDKYKKSIIVGRDPIGVNPLYYGYTEDGEICFASELKSIESYVIRIHEFPPGFCAQWVDDELKFMKYYYPKWQVTPYNQITGKETEQIREVLTRAVEKRLMSDVPYGVLLSGGLDSSLISAIAMKIVKERGTPFGNFLHSFSIGMEGSPDLAAAKKVGDYIGTKHHNFTFTFEDGLHAIKKVIRHLETYDVTTVRASTPMFLLSRKVKSIGVKMVLSGEGADEILGGYLHFQKAPTLKDFHEECIHRVEALHLFDCLRANKSTMAWGLEARVPFLDKEFLEIAMPIHPDLKCKTLESGKKIEKYVLREAFKDGYLPNEILWRQKEQFSDGVGYGWIDGLRRHAEITISDSQMKMAAELYPYNTPKTKEAYLYRQIFESFYPNARACETVSAWVPQTNWAGVSADPSGRAQGAHDAHTEWKE